MTETLRDFCDRTYRQSVTDATAFERAWVKATFDGYSETEAKAGELFLAEEIHYSGGVVRRGVLEKHLAAAVVTLGGVRIPSYTTVGKRQTETSHYSVYRIGSVDITVSAVGDKDDNPRPALLRQARLEQTQMALAFARAETADPDAQLCILFKHGKDRVDSAIPQFAMFEIRSPDGFVVWKHDLLRAQRRYVEDLLDVQAESVPDDEGIPRLRRHLRRFDEGLA